MENDSVRTLGDNTLVDVWIEGRVRAITVSRQAIESHLQLATHEAAAMTETERGEFVRTNLGLIVRSATALLRANPGSDKIVIDAGQLGGPASSGGERRSGGDRRKGDRRKHNAGPPGGVERRGR